MTDRERIFDDPRYKKHAVKAIRRECRTCKWVGSFDATPCEKCEKPGYTMWEEKETIWISPK